ncbi:MAG: 3-deoxy-manno-octulosonate cytidylyltransferase [Methylococcales symbiont of Hymedesmia sp. n. MRB-2018]|nr:MAG: 3-deoxy-manno-octulosonate cytidylyltransferase [Methylococcales symbiont of Hymedesmia sp. n. MRB-2018]
MRAIVVIPARYKSSRFPGKPLVKLLGKEMILWVAELSAVAVGLANVYIATDDERIASVVLKAGFNVEMTSDKCLTGTDRLAEVAAKLSADIYVNVQGDEPLVNPEDIIKVIELKKQHLNCVINAYTSLDRKENPENVNIPKVIVTEGQRLVYMSRASIPGYKGNKNQPENYHKQVCIYAFNKEELDGYAKFGRKSTLEQSEDIEIIRFFEWDKVILMVETQASSFAVDIPEDVDIVEAALRERWL